MAQFDFLHEHVVFIMICMAVGFVSGRLGHLPCQTPGEGNPCDNLHRGKMLGPFSLFRLCLKLELGIGKIRRKLFFLNQYSEEVEKQPSIGISMMLKSLL